MKLERLDINGTKLEKAEVSLVKGGTSTTEFTLMGVPENEQEVYKDGNKIGKPIKMGILLVLLVAMISSISCSSTKFNYERNTKDFKNEDLAFFLSQLYGSDQTIREVSDSKAGVIIMQKIDSLNFVRVIDFIKEHGFPNEKLLGRFYTEYESVSLAAPAILLHNSSKVVQKSTFDLLKQEVQKGNMKSELLALVLDKYYVYNKGYSLYHTQFKKANIKNKEIVNKARLEIGLEALPDSLFINTNNEKKK